MQTVSQPDFWDVLPGNTSPYPLFFSGGRAENDVMLTVDVGEEVEWVVYGGASGALRSHGVNRLKDLRKMFKGIAPDPKIKGTIRGKAAVGWLIPKDAVDKWHKATEVPF